MRYSKTHKDEKRIELVSKAGAIAKQDGFAITGVDRLAASAGLTGGGFYSHFKGKQDLFEEIIRNETYQSMRMLALDPNTPPTAEHIAQALRLYFSKPHVDHPQVGCILPALLPEIARSRPETRHVFESILTEWVSLVDGVLEEDDVYLLISLMAGTIGLVRTLQDEQKQIRILRNALKTALSLLHK